MGKVTIWKESGEKRLTKEMRFELGPEGQETTWHVTMWGQNQWRRENSRWNASGDQKSGMLVKRTQCKIRSKWGWAQASETHIDRMTISGQVVGEIDTETETCSQEFLIGNNIGRNTGSSVSRGKNHRGFSGPHPPL